MKKITITLILLLSALVLKAQSSEPGDVFLQVKQNAELTIQDPNTPEELINICQFKLAALAYIVRQGVKVTGGKGFTYTEMDNQAYALDHFLTQYLTEVTNLMKMGDKSGTKNCIKRYWKITNKNPMFGDKDYETTQVFYGTLTSFSLDTNWIKADEELKTK